MKTLSIRGVDEDLGRLLKIASKNEHKSVNNFVLDVLRKQVGAGKDKRFSRQWQDLDILFGAWSDEEHAVIQGRIDAQRQIDEELWK
jgi:hypothetical protein